jgi:hypothetical protein
MKFSSVFTKLTLAASVATALTSCDDPEYATPTPVTSSSLGQTRILVVNAAPGTTGTSVNLDNAGYAASLPYLTAGPSYSTVSGGQRLLVINDPANIPAVPANPPAGTVTPTTPRTLAVRSAYTAGLNYTVFITDQPTRAFVVPVTASSNQGGIQTLTLIDDLSAPATATNAKIRFVNLAPPSGSYGIFNSTTNTALFSAVPIRPYRAINSGTTAPVTNYATFTEVPAGSYNLDVRSTASTAIAGTQQTITFAAGKIYTLYVRGVAGNATTPLGISTVLHN